MEQNTCGSNKIPSFYTNLPHCPYIYLIFILIINWLLLPANARNVDFI
jgi:hypothetical protein